MISDLLHRIKWKWMKIRLQPIRVFCLHHVCAEFEAESMNRGDWMQMDEFKQKVQALRANGVEFISLTDAYRHISTDWLRCKKYAALTFDDGYASLKEILLWLEEQKIPATLFVNGKYLDGNSYRKNPKEKYLSKEELYALTSPMVEIGSHGWEHMDASQMSIEDFEQNIIQNVNILSAHPRYIPYHAYTWGRHTSKSDKILADRNIIPVLIDGIKNRKDVHFVHRELLN